MSWNSRNEYIVPGKQTQGSETSQYLKEKKAIAIPLVAASERGTAQTELILWPAGVDFSVLWGLPAVSAETTESYQSLG